VPLPEEIAALLATPAESTTVDFKDQIDWASRRGKLELVRDVVCLANRTGGRLIIGVQDRGGRFTPVGLAEGATLPDPTDIVNFGRTYFDPMPTFTVHEVAVDNTRYGVISVDEFSRTPFICRAIGNDETNRAVLRPGTIYRRSDGLQCSQIQTAVDLQGLLETAVAKTRRMTTEMIQAGAGPGAPIAQAELQIATDEPLQICDLQPTTALASLGLTATTDKIEAATIRLRHGDPWVPRAIDIRRLGPSGVVREHGRVLIERSAASPNEERLTTSVIEVARGPVYVRIRQGLDATDRGVNVSGFIGFVLGCLEFARRFFQGTEAGSVNVRLGLASPAGAYLTVNENAFHGFNQTYVATSGPDVVAERNVDLAEFEDDAIMRAVARSACLELLEYFGWQPSDEGYESQVNYVVTRIPDLLRYMIP
jgi:hypothetical protein